MHECVIFHSTLGCSFDIGNNSEISDFLISSTRTCQNHCRHFVWINSASCLTSPVQIRTGRIMPDRSLYAKYWAIGWVNQSITMIAPRRAPLTLMTFWKFHSWIILVYSCAYNVLFICFGLQIIKVGFFFQLFTLIIFLKTNLSMKKSSF